MIINKELIEKYLDLCSQTDFPQTVLTKTSISRNINTLRRIENKNSNTCIQLIQHYHPSLWKANKKGYSSPYNAWYDNDLLYESIVNRLIYIGDELSPKDIRRGFTVGYIAPKVSIFRPALAKYIISKYLNRFSTIFDPCAGYSGRLLGAWACDKKYIGQDINIITVAESNKLINDLDLKNCQVMKKNSIATTGEYDCLFTCPPYGDKENWHQGIEILSADEWIDICLKNYNCKRYVFVIDKTIKYKDKITETLVNTSYLSKAKEYIIVIDK